MRMYVPVLVPVRVDSTLDDGKCDFQNLKIIYHYYSDSSNVGIMTFTLGFLQT